MTSLLLAEKIFELLIYMMLGFILTKMRVLKKPDAETLSKLCLFLFNPCILIAAFQIDMTASLLQSLLVALCVAMVIFIVFILMGYIYSRYFNGTPVEETSIVYSNCGNLMIPIIIAFYGELGVIYVTPFTVLFNVFMWTHAVWVFHKSEPLKWKSAFLNINIIAIIIGILLMALKIRLPAFPLAIMHTLGEMIGPSCMIMTGIIMAGLDVSMLKTYKRMPLIILLRLAICPAIIWVILFLTQIVRRFPDSADVLSVMLLASGAPAANMVTQFSLLYDQDPEYGSAICVLSTILCVITMPLVLGAFNYLRI